MQRYFSGWSAPDGGTPIVATYDSAGTDFSSAIGGGRPAVPGSGLVPNDGADFNTLIGGYDSGSDAGGASGYTNIGSQIGSTVGGPVGGVVGGIVGGIVGALTGGGTHAGTGLFAGLHSGTLEPLDDSKWNDGDAKLTAWMARQNNISVEEVAAVMAHDMASTGHSAQDVWDSYAYNGTSGNGANNLAGWISRFNATRKALILSGTLGPANLTVASLPGIVNWGGTARVIDLAVKGPGSTVATVDGPSVPTTTAPPVTATVQALGNALGFTGGSTTTVAMPTRTVDGQSLTAQDGKTILQGGWGGFLKGLSDAWAGTQDGKDFKVSYGKDWLKENQLLAFGLAVLLSFGGYHIYTLFSRNRKTSS